MSSSANSNKGTPHKESADKQLEYRASMAAAKCAMSLNQAQTAVNALFVLNRDFPHDPEVLYITTHYFSELALRTSQELAREAPGSYQAHETEAEAFESKGHWAEAAAEYQKISGPKSQYARHSLPLRPRAVSAKSCCCFKTPGRAGRT